MQTTEMIPFNEFKNNFFKKNDVIMQAQLLDKKVDPVIVIMQAQFMEKQDSCHCAGPVHGGGGGPCPHRPARVGAGVA